MGKHDFDGIRLQNPLSETIGRYISLKKNGSEYEALCPFHSEDGPSFTVTDAKGFYHCFGCGAHGDVTDFVAKYHNVGITEACAILGGTRIADDSAQPVRRQSLQADPYAGYTYLTPPASAVHPSPSKPIKVRNPKRDEPGKPGFTTYIPSMVFPYCKTDGTVQDYVIRQDLPDGGKMTPGIFWMRSPDGFEGWCHGVAQEPRSLYGVETLARNPTWQVFVVEGEKKADALRSIMNACVVGWRGGTNGVDKTDWSPLAGRQVMLWGDADQPGENAILGCVKNDAWCPGVAELVHKAGAEWIKVAPWDRDKPKGWDAADAKAGWTDKDTGEIHEPWDKNAVVAWLRARLEKWEPKAPTIVMTMPEKPKLKAEPVQEVRQTQQAKPDPDELDQKREQKRKETEERRKVREEEEREAAWKAKLIYGKEEKLAPKSQMNAQLLIEHHPSFRGVFVHDAFANKVLINRRPPWEPDTGTRWIARHRTDNDTSRARAHLETLGITIGQDDTGRAINAASENISVNLLRDYLEGLKWDGTPRLAGEDESAGADRIPGWLTTYLGADDTPSNRAFGLRWMISAAARVLKPGCKVDTMLILEGPQGLKKSTALRTLGAVGGRSYYTDEIAEINSKDAAMQLQGVWIVEIAELSTLGRAEVNAIKAWLTRQTDRFRPPYGKEIADFPRACVLAGTVNPLGGGYLRDATGGRRFWPVECKPVTAEGTIDIEALERDRAQLWAEAVHRFKAGEPWWLDSDETDTAKDVQADRYEDDIWSDKIDDFLDGRAAIRIADIMSECIGLAIKDQKPADEKRIASHLRTRGWTRKKIRAAYEKTPKWAYVPPAA